MSAHHLARLAVAAAAIAAGVSAAAPTVASAAPCPDVDVVFARGTGEAPGVGNVGQSFVDAVRARTGARSVDVYAVDYAASSDFDAREQFAETVIDGIRDAGAHVRNVANTCPNTRVVLGGYSQGAVVSGFVTSAVVPAGVPANLVPKPLPPEVANHVAAVVLFGKPSPEFLRQYDAPAVDIGPAYAGKTLELCAPGDTICENVPSGGPTFAHTLYAANGMTDQGADYAVSRL